MTPFVAIGLLFLFLLIGLPIYLSLGFLALLLFWHEGTPLIALTLNHCSPLFFAAKDG